MSVLDPFFERFCENFDKKLTWSKMKGDSYSEAMLKYFEEAHNRSSESKEIRNPFVTG